MLFMFLLCFVREKESKLKVNMHERTIGNSLEIIIYNNFIKSFYFLDFNICFKNFLIFIFSYCFCYDRKIDASNIIEADY